MQVYSGEQADMVPGEHPRVVVVTDGMRRMSYLNGTGIGSVLPQDPVDSTVNHVPLCDLLMFGGKTETWGEKLQRFFDASAKNGEQAAGKRFTYAGQENVDGIACHKLVFTADSLQVSSRVETWICGDYDYAVVKERQLSKPKHSDEVGYGHFYVAQDFTQVAPGVWLPHKVIRQTFIYDPAVSEPWRRTEVATSYNLRANTGTTEADFQFEFPLGTMISDPEGLYVSDVPGVIREASEYFVAGEGGVTAPLLEQQSPPLDPVLSGQ